MAIHKARRLHTPKTLRKRKEVVNVSQPAQAEEMEQKSLAELEQSAVEGALDMAFNDLDKNGDPEAIVQMLTVYGIDAVLRAAVQPSWQNFANVLNNRLVN